MCAIVKLGSWSWSSPIIISKLKKRTRAYVIIQMHPQPTTLTTFLGGGSRRKYKEMVVEGRGPKVQESKVPRAQGPRYLKVTFKYELDSKEGPSCWALKTPHFLGGGGHLFYLLSRTTVLAISRDRVNSKILRI